jgi:hypothetical protein
MAAGRKAALVGIRKRAIAKGKHPTAAAVEATYNRYHKGNVAKAKSKKGTVNPVGFVRGTGGTVANPPKPIPPVGGSRTAPSGWSIKPPGAPADTSTIKPLGHPTGGRKVGGSSSSSIAVGTGVWKKGG